MLSNQDIKCLMLIVIIVCGTAILAMGLVLNAKLMTALGALLLAAAILMLINLKKHCYQILPQIAFILKQFKHEG